MAKVRKFNTGVTVAAQVTTKPSVDTAENVVPDIPEEAVKRVSSSAPVQIRSDSPGNPRKRRYKQKTYSILQEDIDRIESLLVDIRQAGLYERGRSDIVRAGVRLLCSLSLEQQLQAVNAVESLKR